MLKTRARLSRVAPGEERWRALSNRGELLHACLVSVCRHTKRTCMQIRIHTHIHTVRIHRERPACELRAKSAKSVRESETRASERAFAERSAARDSFSV